MCGTIILDCQLGSPSAISEEANNIVEIVITSREVAPQEAQARGRKTAISTSEVARSPAGIQLSVVDYPYSPHLKQQSASADSLRRSTQVNGVSVSPSTGEPVSDL